MGSAADNFNRANESPLASPWALQFGLNFNLLSQSVVQAGGSGDTYWYYTGAATSLDQYSQAKMLGSSGLSDDGGPAVRIQGAGHSTGQEGYAYDVATGGGIIKHVNAAFTQITGGGGPLTSGMVLRIEVTGNGPATLKSFENGVQKLTGSDSSLTTAGLGVGMFGFDLQVSGFDDWSGGDITAPSNPILAVHAGRFGPF